MVHTMHRLKAEISAAEYEKYVGVQWEHTYNLRILYQILHVTNITFTLKLLYHSLVVDAKAVFE